MFRDASDADRLRGFEVEILEALARAMGEPIEPLQYEYSSLLPGLERGDFDLAMNGLEVTPDRAARVRFSRPYYTYRLQLVARRDDPRFDSIESCAGIGCAVGTLGDTAAERLLDARGMKKRVYDGQIEPYRDLALGRTDAVLLDRPIALYYAAEDPALRFTGEPFERGSYAIAMRKDRADLAARVDEGLGKLSESGELRAILERWKLWDDTQVTSANAAPTDAVTARFSPRQYVPLLLDGLRTTLWLSFASMLFAVALGLPIALSRLFGPRPLRFLAAAYVELFRGVPVLLVLFFLYYGLPTFGVRLGPLTAAVLGFSLNYAAYEAEIQRAAISSVPIGQWEAAASLGMSRPLAFRRVIAPQALRLALPAMTNDFVALFKETSLVSVIAVIELTKQYQMLAKSTLQYLELGVATGALYLLVSAPLGYLSRVLEQRFAKEGA